MLDEENWTQPADERILRYLSENPPDYVPLVANRLGLHLGYVERRVDVLVSQGLLEAVTGEEVYVTTDCGESCLAEAASSAAADADD